MMVKVYFMSERTEWSTPDDLYDELNKEFHFDLDACASDENHKCDHYYTKHDDSLKKSWGGHIVL
jgi:phage N-6-adenine-methyltransferase